MGCRAPRRGIACWRLRDRKRGMARALIKRGGGTLGHAGFARGRRESRRRVWADGAGKKEGERRAPTSGPGASERGGDARAAEHVVRKGEAARRAQVRPLGRSAGRA